MPQAPEFNLDQFAAALADKVGKMPVLKNTSQFLDLVMGKPVKAENTEFRMQLTDGEKRDWLTTIDAFLTNVKDADPKSALLPKFVQLKTAHKAEIPVGTFDTPLGRLADTTLSGAAYIELHSLWADQQPLR